ncbi:MAG: hypothetical protein P8M80_05690 [Pirellulaceae bacterium]|nr:hypothetical protein [Pirellulaceae bacterium]
MFYGIGFFVILIPTLLLIARSQVMPEALLWSTVSTAAFLLEIRGVRREIVKSEARRKLYHIADISQTEE